jgi:hypothetical protein
MKKWLTTLLVILIISILQGTLFEPSLHGYYIWGCIVGIILGTVYPLWKTGE